MTAPPHIGGDVRGLRRRHRNSSASAGSKSGHGAPARPHFPGQQAYRNARTYRGINRPGEPGRCDLMRKSRFTPEQILSPLQQTLLSPTTARLMPATGPVRMQVIYYWRMRTKAALSRHCFPAGKLEALRVHVTARDPS